MGLRDDADVGEAVFCDGAVSRNSSARPRKDERRSVDGMMD
jgi:hypothetical protein